VERYDWIGSWKVDPSEDNTLAITTDGHKLGLNGRMHSSRAEGFPGSKVNALGDKVAAIWQRTAATNGTQIVFCDMREAFSQTSSTLCPYSRNRPQLNQERKWPNMVGANPRWCGIAAAFPCRRVFPCKAGPALAPTCAPAKMQSLMPFFLMIVKLAAQACVTE
jgi:hypothetical protein